jgi:hypothetical protein
MVIAPPATNVVITPLASLALAAARDPNVLEELDLTTQEAVGNRMVLNHVFKKFGYDEDAMVMDLLTFENATLARPVFTAFYGTNIQLAGLFSVMSSALKPLVAQTGDGGSRRLLQSSSADIQQELQKQLATNIYSQLSILPLTSSIRTGDSKVIARIMEDTYASVCDTFGDVPEVDDSKRAAFFLGVAKVSAATGTCTYT